MNTKLIALTLFLSLSCCHPPRVVIHRRGGVSFSNQDHKIRIKNSENIRVIIMRDSILIDTIL